MVFGRRATRQETATYLGLSIRQIIQLEKNQRMKYLKSLDTYVSEENETTLGDLVAFEEDIEALVLERVEQEELQ